MFHSWSLSPFGAQPGQAGPHGEGPAAPRWPPPGAAQLLSSVDLAFVVPTAPFVFNSPGHGAPQRLLGHGD